MEENVFSRTPLKIILWSKKQEAWSQKILVILGTRIPPKVKAEILDKYKLHKNKKTISESKLLIAWFGKSWRHKLMFEVKGGADESFDAMDVTGHQEIEEKIEIPEV